jgi:SAM-dependent methyltransferase
MDSSAGYLTEVDYTYGYYREQSPRLIEYQLLLNGYEPPAAKALTYLELGYGQGVSANIHAAAFPGRFIGTDINPVHATNAQALAHASHADATFYNQSFAEFLDQRDLRAFDYIVLHGIWSWVSDAVRGEIVEILRRHLKPGGAVYVSYNALPGWAAQMPLRHLLKFHTDIAGNDSQSMTRRVDASIDFAKRLRDAGARYFAANPASTDMLDRMPEQDHNYLAHEFLNLDWVPMYFSEVNERLSAAKLSFACPALPLEGIDALSFTPQQREILKTCENVALQQSIRDYFLNARFRRDIFTRGARRLSRSAQVERLGETRIAMAAARGDFPYAAQCGLGRLALKKEIYDPLLDALQGEGWKPKSLSELARYRGLASLPFESLVEAVAVLIGTGFAAPAQSEEAVEIAEPRCRDLNAHLLNNARLGGEIAWLASPVIGGGVQVSRFDQLFLDARKRGLAESDAWADSAWDVVKAQGRSIIKDGKALGTEQENIAELRTQAARFADMRLPVLIALRVA